MRGACGVLAALPILALAGPLPPEQLRADGSDFTRGRDASLAYAVRHDRRIQFTWAPRHTKAGAAHKTYRLTVVDVATGAEHWASGERVSAAATAHYDGPPFEPGRLYKWSVAWGDGVATSDPAEAYFRTGLVDAGWAGVAWVGADDTNVYRGAFTLPAGATHVAMYLCGLGFSDTAVNGHPAAPGSALVSAPWTANHEMNMYSTYDITPRVVEGANVVVVELGHGWRDRLAFPVKDTAAEGYDAKADRVQKVFRMVVEATLANGTVQRVLASGAGWNATQGPVVADSVYNGETYDARIAAGLEGMHEVRYVSAPPLWAPAALTSGPPGRMYPWAAPAVMVDKEYAAVSVSYPQPGVAVVDFGSNVAGVVRLRNINVTAGARVTIRHGEALNHPGIPFHWLWKNGTIYTGNLRTAKATDVFISDGTTTEYMPRFTYHGFRYAEITGYGGALSAADVSLVHFHSAIPQRTNVTFGTPLLNALQRMALGATRSNAMTLMTDCPQRDERLGWNGDSALSSETYAVNYDAGAFLRHIIHVQAAEVDPEDASLPDVAPFVRYGNRPADVSWSISLAQLMHTVYQAFGDVSTVEEYLPVAAAHLQWVDKQAARGLRNMHTTYGDWCPPKQGIFGIPELPSKPYTTAFSYVQMTDLLCDLSAAAGNHSAASGYARAATALRQRFHDAFYNNASGTIDTDVMTVYALAAALNNSHDLAAAQAGLVRLVGRHANHLSCGIIGFRQLFDALHSAGRAELGLAVLEQTDYPSIGYFLSNSYEPASENLWELLDAPKQGIAMNSRNHHMWSSYSAYLVRRLGGVDLLSRTLRPPPLTLDLPSAHTTTRLPSGDVEFAWARIGGVQCGKGFIGEALHPHANRLDLNCGTGGGIIESVLFASYGAALGTQCGAYETRPACHHPQSEAVVTARCVGKASCSVSLQNFSPLPCATHMRAAVRCSGSALTTLTARVPIGAEYVLEVPSGAVLQDPDTQAVRGVSGQRLPLPSGASFFVLVEE
eukprot:TRINITY_DN6576_c0_g2_i1.p1 TRINITY_DN6576_c0_g2~~TRINITY_DN6576_c0_g2_i1.p1  ORF type:complete len:1005 (+),score=96.11 TRINITY_DN6576_c0_g2_i1:61-3075(+)